MQKVHDASNYVYSYRVLARIRSGKADSGGMISRTSGRSGSGKRETSPCAPKFVQFVLAAALMEWYLQTRTNTPINYKTILVLQAPKAPTGPAGRLPSSRRPRCAARSLRLFHFNRPELLITRILNLEKDRGHSFLFSILSLRQTLQIFDTRNPMRKKTAKIRSARIMKRRSYHCKIAGSGCGKLMWKSEEDCGRI